MISHQGLLLLYINSIREKHTPEDLLFPVLLDWEIASTLPFMQKNLLSQTVADENTLASCFDKHITKEFVKKLANYKPVRIVFHDANFGRDSLKINVEQIFKIASPSTNVKTI